MSLSLPYDEGRRDKDVKLEDNLYTPVDSDIGYTIECDIKTPDNIKDIPFCPENKISPQDKFNDHLNEMKPDF